MAWHLIKSGGDGEEFGFAHKEFLIDSESDISTEPTAYGPIAIGSRAHIAGFEKEYEKCNNGSWQQVSGNVSIHVCSSNEYDHETGIPVISTPKTGIVYLVPDGSGNDLFVEWIYVDDAWEKFGSASIDLSGYVTDVTVNGTSVVTNGVANVPMASVQPDGYYKNMTVGNAERLVTTVGIENNFPYNFRISGGANELGDREVDKVVGGSIAWNQLLQPITGSPLTVNGVTITANGDGSVTLNGTASAAGVLVSCPAFPTVAGHKYFMGISGSIEHNGYTSIGGNISFQQTIRAETSTSEVNNGVYIRSSAGTVYNNNVMWPVCFDLTQMFGSRIADYIYFLEQTSAGAGVEWFRELFPKPYYAYNAGTLMHVQTSAHKMTGFNQLDLSKFAELYPDYCAYHDGELTVNTVGELFSVGIPVNIPADVAGGYMTFDVKLGTATNVGFIFVYADGTTGGTGRGGNTSGFTTIQGTLNSKRVVAIRMNWTTLGTFTIKNACINLRWDGERDGEYEPYEERTYPLDSDLVLRGIPKLDANNNLYYDGDEYASDGTVTRKYGIVDLGTLAWGKNDHATLGTYFYGAISDIHVKHEGNFGTVAYSAACPKYIVTKRDASYITDKSFWFDGNYEVGEVTQIQVRDSAYSDAAAFKTAMNGVYLVYELATPTTEEADPYQNPQVVNDWGTEEYVDSRTVPIPVGHETLYPVNLVGRLEMAPDNPSWDGDFVLRHEDNENFYVPLANAIDVQVNGTSVVSNGVANIPKATGDSLGVIKISSGLAVSSAGSIYVSKATDTYVKTGTNEYNPIVPYQQHRATFYGLAKAAGDSTQSASANAVGTYTESAKSAINTMLNDPEIVSGSTPSITAKAGVQYVCGEVSTLSITTPLVGCVDIIFESGSTPTALTIAPTGGQMSDMKWMGGWDGTCEANTSYEINVLDGVYGVVGSWSL